MGAKSIFISGPGVLVGVGHISLTLLSSCTQGVIVSYFMKLEVQGVLSIFRVTTLSPDVVAWRPEWGSTLRVKLTPETSPSLRIVVIPPRGMGLCP